MDKFLSLLNFIGKDEPAMVKPLPLSGSNRKYYRFFFENGDTLIGSFNPDVKENEAHYVFTKHFRKKGLPVPDILAKDETFQYFILEDLGDDTLLALKEKEGLSERIKGVYHKAVKDLLRFQVEGIKDLDISKAYPSGSFDYRSVMWDLNYFKYSFVKTNDISFDENLLENDFERFAKSLLDTDLNFFMYRDFQARNIMVKDDSLWYIDFQGGRKGPLQYDVVSLLYQAKAALPDEFRDELLEVYLRGLEEILPGQSADFKKYYPHFVYFRLMQVLGAYGFRGLFQKKSHFLQSIPFAIENLKNFMDTNPFSDEYPELKNVLIQIADLKSYDFPTFSKDKLNVLITSFSYKKTGYPVDITENGGGFVFDCRALPNPGRIAELKDFTGLDKEVIEYLETKHEVKRFLDNIFELVDLSIDNYLERGFSNLAVNFGCTGGQHRSVYSAEKLKKHLNEKYNGKLNIILKHIELEKR